MVLMSYTLSKLWTTVPASLSKFQQNLQVVSGRQATIGLFVFVAYLILHRLILWPFFFSPLRKIPGPSVAGHIILGQPRTLNTPWRKWAHKYGPIFRMIGTFGTEWLIITKPEALHQVLVKDWAQYPRPKFQRRMLGITAGFGLFAVTGDEHKRMRKAMNPAFSTQNLIAQADMYWESIDRLIYILDAQISSSPEGEIVKLFDWMMRLTLDIICETAFGYKANTLHSPHCDLGVACRTMSGLQSGHNLGKFRGLVMMPGAPRFIQSNWAYRMRSLFESSSFSRDLSTLIGGLYEVRNFSREMLDSKLRDAIRNTSDVGVKRDIMSLLVRAKQTAQEGSTEKYALNDQAMIDQVLTFLVAGHEPTAAGLTWTLWLLANDKQSQCRLRKELAPVMGKNARPDIRALKDLRWLDCVVMESLRVMPPAPVVNRTAQEEGVLDGIVIPKGTMLYIPIHIINTAKATWGEDAEVFRPERWLDPPKAYPSHSSLSVLSFIAGPHSCIGKTMAIYEMKAILAGLIANFEFSPAYAGQSANPDAAITMIPTDGMPLRMRRIQRAD